MSIYVVNRCVTHYTECIWVHPCRNILHRECLPLVRAATGIELTDTIDMTCSKYQYTGE